MKQKVKVQIVSEEGEIFFGIGVAELLHDVEKTGSLNSACQIMNLSYSKAWKMINRAERQLGQKFIIRTAGGKHGGGSVLTEEGSRFLRKYDCYNQKVQKCAEELFAEFFLL